MTGLKPLRILVTGSRNWKDLGLVCDALLDTLPDPIEPGRDYVIVHGDCNEGPDSVVNRWCEDNAWWVDDLGGALVAEPHPADWNQCAPTCNPAHRRPRRDRSTYCPAAGLRRDAEMVAAGADLCLAFIAPCVKQGCRKIKPHGSHGATKTADLAEKAGITVRRRFQT